MGTLGGPCFSNGTCNAGLVCVVPNQCVLPDAGSDAPSSDATTSDAPSDAPAVDAGPCPTTGLLAWWKGESSPADEENYLALLEKAGASYVSSAHAGSAFNLSGTSYFEATPGAHATLPDITSTLTIDAWVDPTSVDGTILSRRSDTGNGYEFRLVGGRLTFQAGSFTVTGTATIAAATAHHVAVTVSQSSIQLYFDGSPDGSPFPATNAIQADTAIVRVGTGWGAAQVPKNTFTGWIDELTVYSKPLSASDIGLVYAGNFTKCH